MSDSVGISRLGSLEKAKAMSLYYSKDEGGYIMLAFSFLYMHKFYVSGT